MTRKRFIKLMMAEGYSRNEAREWAEGAAFSGVSYAELYRSSTFRWSREFERIYEAAEKIRAGCIEAINATAANIQAALDRIGNISI